MSGGSGDARQPDSGISVKHQPGGGEADYDHQLLQAPPPPPQFLRPSDIPVIYLLAPASKDEEKILTRCYQGLPFLKSEANEHTGLKKHL